MSKHKGMKAQPGVKKPQMRPTGNGKAGENFMRRLGAYAIDWFLSGVLVGLPGVITYNVLTGNHDPFSNLYMIPSAGLDAGWAYGVCAMSLAVFLLYFVVIPLKVWPGQTPGKRLLKIKVVRRDGGAVNLTTLLLRHAVGLLVVEGSATLMSTYLRQALTLATGFYFEAYLQVAGYVLTLVSTVLVFATKRSLALHDYIAGTEVVRV